MQRTLLSPTKKAERVSPKRWRKATTYLIPPIVIPAALAIVIAIYILLQGLI